MRRKIRVALTLVPVILRLARMGLIRRYVVEGRDMLRAFSPGDRLIIDGFTYRLRSPRLGEVVVIRPPYGRSRLDLRRVVAAPGATVTLRGAPYVLSEDEWYLLGDNLNESKDSRQLGPVKRGDIVGRVWFRY
jgi:signal peptidase I